MPSNEGQMGSKSRSQHQLYLVHFTRDTCPVRLRQQSKDIASLLWESSDCSLLTDGSWEPVHTSLGRVLWLCAVLDRPHSRDLLSEDAVQCSLLVWFTRCPDCSFSFFRFLFSFVSHWECFNRCCQQIQRFDCLGQGHDNIFTVWGKDMVRGGCYDNILIALANVMGAMAVSGDSLLGGVISSMSLARAHVSSYWWYGQFCVKWTWWVLTVWLPRPWYPHEEV